MIIIEKIFLLLIICTTISLQHKILFLQIARSPVTANNSQILVSVPTAAKIQIVFLRIKEVANVALCNAHNENKQAKKKATSHLLFNFLN